MTAVCAQLQREYKSFQAQGLTPDTRRVREPVKEIHERISVPGEGRRTVMVFQLIERLPNDLLRYAASCPRCNSKKAIVAETKLVNGVTQHPFRNGFAQLCEKCEDALDLAIEVETE